MNENESLSIIEQVPQSTQQLSLAQALQVAIAQHKAGKLDTAEDLYRKIIAMEPGVADAQHLLGAILYQRGQHGEAMQYVEQAMTLRPDQSFYYNTRGRIHLALGNLDQAVLDIQHAVELEPQNAEAHFNFAETLMLKGNTTEAAQSYHRALTLRPIYAEANAGYGNALRTLGDLGGALPYYQLAATLQPQSAAFGLNLALAFHMLGHLDLAIPRYETLAEKYPDLLEARLNLAGCYALAGNKKAAIDVFEKLRTQAPGHPTMLDGLYEARRQACDWRDLGQLENDCMRVLRAGLAEQRVTGFRGFTVLYLPTSAEEIRENNRFICEQISKGVQGHLYQPQPQRARIRLGYMTADVKEHPTAHLILNLFELHDTEHFEIFLYSWAQDDKSEHRRRIKASVEHFVECYHLPDKDIAERIAADGIDVLVDLMGHTADNRLGVLARRPAALQLGYLGYPGTYGGLVDYLIADPVVMPEGREGVETVEAVARMPHCYQINSHRQIPLGEKPTRQEAGLPEQGLVFCCMNNSYKLDPFVFSIWCRLLEQIPGSHLWLLQGPQEMVTNLREAASAQGIQSERLIFAPRVSRQQHLTRLQCADMFLDTRFYNAHTTATDALWAGVPVLTVAGETFSARVAASLVHALEMPELVQPDWAGYEAEALRLAQHPDRLAELRARLWQKRDQAPLFDTKKWVRNVETLYENLLEQREATQN